MTDDPHGARDIPIGMPVQGYNGTLLGYVREIHPHYLLVGQEGQLQVSVNRESVTLVDNVETTHRQGEE